jgi:hypothetical protein
MVGGLAVVISLIYLAIQVRSNARETRLAAMRSTLDFLTRFTQQIAEHADLAESRHRGLDDFTREPELHAHNRSGWVPRWRLDSLSAWLRFARLGCLAAQIALLRVW